MEKIRRWRSDLPPTVLEPRGRDATSRLDLPHPKGEANDSEERMQWSRLLDGPSFKPLLVPRTSEAPPPRLPYPLSSALVYRIPLAPHLRLSYPP
ncbi:hypothetical protein PENTCL1PPCAC_1105 [Pristionchus entomophagus]|uniref:Uncharacterized protein n=1 Tax=Pristionchus entomophagus TaxID=358040 RepID=A0AAV5SFJ4_9BILA|nr:hypothetical protein PENTCL1PPCAC_1105 [Pristionchus entomophagus]